MTNFEDNFGDDDHKVQRDRTVLRYLKLEDIVKTLIAVVMMMMMVIITVVVMMMMTIIKVVVVMVMAMLTSLGMVKLSRVR